MGCLVLSFSYGADNVPCCAWLAPLFLLCFARSQRLGISMPVLFLAETAAIAFQFRGMFPGAGSHGYLLRRSSP